MYFCPTASSISESARSTARPIFDSISENEEYEDWEGSELQKDFEALKTPGKLVRAYRARHSIPRTSMRSQ